MRVFGKVKEVNSFCVQAIELMSRDPAYQNSSLIQIKLLLDEIKRGNYYCELSDEGELESFLVFYTIEQETAQRCIAENRAPSFLEFQNERSGDCVFIKAVTGKQTKSLLKNFFKFQIGKIILYKRHFKSNSRLDQPVLKYITPEGKVRSADSLNQHL